MSRVEILVQKYTDLASVRSGGSARANGVLQAAGAAISQLERARTRQKKIDFCEQIRTQLQKDGYSRERAGHTRAHYRADESALLTSLT